MRRWIAAEIDDEQLIRAFTSSKSGLVVVMPSRRSTELSRRNWERLGDLAGSPDVSAVVLIDKTPDATATSLLCSEFPGGDFGDQSTPAFIVRRPFSEDPFVSYASLPRIRNKMMMQVHDDDSWTGQPALPIEFAKPPTVAALPVVTLGSSRGNSHVNLFFGASVDRVWNAFMDVVSLLGTPAATMDQTFTFWLRNMPLGPPLRNFVYDYDNANWSDVKRARRANRENAEALGWGQLSTPEALSWTFALDTLSSLPLLGQLAPAVDLRPLSDHLLRFTPPFEPGAARLVLKALPRPVRMGVVATRGEGRNWRRLTSSIVYRRSGTQREAKARILIQGGMRKVTLSKILDDLLPSLTQEASAELIPRIEVWRDQLRVLTELLDEGPPSRPRGN